MNPPRELGSAAPGHPGWRLFTLLLLAAVFTETVFAGAMMSGQAWARQAHMATASLLVATAFGAGMVGTATLRRVPRGVRMSLALLALGVTLLLQAAVGMATARGANLLWLHVPLGVALVGFTAQAAAAARRLGEA